MEQPVPSAHKLQWKWVIITLAMYIAFYLAPIFISVVWSRLRGSHVDALIVGGWAFSGIIIVAAAAGYISKGVTILEPGLASVSMIILWIIVFTVLVPGVKFDLRTDTMPTLIILGAVFVLSLLGAWMGERAQVLWKKQ